MITLCRIAATPVLGGLVYHQHHQAALGLFTVAALSDVVSFASLVHVAGLRLLVV